MLSGKWILKGIKIMEKKKNAISADNIACYNIIPKGNVNFFVCLVN